MDSYNGWTNYQTWNVNLWLSNDESSYNDLRRGMPADGWDEDSLEEYVKGVWPTGTPDFSSKKEYEEVNWSEISESLNIDEGIYPEVLYQAQVDSGLKIDSCTRKFILSFTSEFSLKTEFFIIDDFLIDPFVTLLENARNGSVKNSDARKQLLLRGSKSIKEFIEDIEDLEFEDFEYCIVYVDSSGFAYPVEVKELKTDD